MNNMKKLIVLGLSILILLIIALLWNLSKEEVQVRVESFEECLAFGFLVSESYPRECRTPQGQTFVEDIGNELEKTDLIIIENPRPNQIISSPLFIKGEARGFWFFEADFPIRLYDEKGGEIAFVSAQAREEWMTEDFVSFEAILEFSTPQTQKGLLVFEKDNPSGLVEFEDELKMPVRFFEK